MSSVANGRFHIGINAHLLSTEDSYRRAGIHQYIAQVLRHLPQDEGMEYTIFSQYQPPFMQRPDFAPVASRWPTERRIIRILWEQIAWPWQARQRRLDLLHSMAFVTPLLSRRPAIVTIYDLSFIHFPDRFPRLQRQYLTAMSRRACHHARRIITISESGRQDVHRFFGVPLERIAVVYPGVDSVYKPLPAGDVAAFRREKGLPDRFLLHVGTLQPRKNIPVLLEAFARVVKSADAERWGGHSTRSVERDGGLHLLLVGGKGWLFDEIFRRVEELGIQKRVHFTGYVPDSELPLWYNAAAAFVFPSVYEGFGMPVVEAMACGTPVIASNASSIPEAAGMAARLFVPQDVEGLAAAITAVIQSPPLQQKMRQQGRRQAASFSWERAGMETAVVYREARGASKS